MPPKFKTSKRRTQMSKSILDAAIEKEETRKAYRETYNKQPKVIARRTLYNKKRNGEMKAASQFVAGKITKVEAEGMITLLGKEYDEAVVRLEGGVPARSTKHTDN